MFHNSMMVIKSTYNLRILFKLLVINYEQQSAANYEDIAVKCWLRQ